MRSARPEPVSSDVRARIVAAAAELMAAGGADAATTRAVAIAAGVQAPTIYRLFGDKRGLLDAVAQAALARYVAGKADRAGSGDPVADLREAWDEHLAFCLANPAIFALMTGTTPSAAAGTGVEILRERVQRVARAGLLRVGEERATDLIHATGTGVVLVLTDPRGADRADLAAAAREAVMAAILAVPDERSTGGAAAAASGLRSGLGDLAMFTPGERLLLDELLRRIADS